MRPLYSPESEIELLILRSILDDAGIPYFVRNESFGSLYLGPHVEAYNRKTICVPAPEADEARALLGEYLRRTRRGAAEAEGDGAADPGHAPWLLRLLDRLLERWHGGRSAGRRGGWRWPGDATGEAPVLRVIRNEDAPPAPPPPPAGRNGRTRRPRLRLVHGFRPRSASSTGSSSASGTASSSESGFGFASGADRGADPERDGR